MQFVNETSCDVGRKARRNDGETPPCENIATSRVVYMNGGDGEPMTLNVCDEHLPELAPSQQPLKMEGMCMAGRQLTGMTSGDLPCPYKFTEIVHALGIDGGFVFELCDMHRAMLPTQPLL